MTAHDLHHLGASITVPVTYEGGMDLEAGQSVAVKSRNGRITVAPNFDFEGLRGFAHLVIDISPEESAELRLALEQAERVAQNYKTRRTR